MDMNRQLYRSNVVSGDYLHNTINMVLTEISDNVKTTYGPYGGHGLIATATGCEPTKDGLTILSAMQFNQSISKLVHKAATDVSIKQVDEVGDGSTSTVLLLVEIYKRLVKLDFPPTQLKIAMREVVDRITAELKKEAIEVDNKILYDTIYTSVDGNKDLTDEIMATLNELPSIEPLILLEYSPTDNHAHELTKGVELDGTIIRPDVFFNGQSRMSYENPYIIAVNGRVDLSPARLMELVDFTRKAGCDVIFLCSGISEDILNNCVTINRTNPGVFSRIAFFQMLQTAINDTFMDICSSIGASPVDSESLRKVTNFDILSKILNANAGTAVKVTLSEFNAKFAEPARNEEMIKLRIEEINTKIDDLKKDSTAHNLKISDLETRKAFLSNNYAKLFIGGVSSQRKAINFELAADAIPQVISSRKHGVVMGCNTIVPKIVKRLIDDEDELLTNNLHSQLLKLVYDSYITLFAKIVENKIGDETKALDIVRDHISKNGFTPLNLRDKKDTHIIYNSADTDRAILESATDMAVLLATTKTFITPQPEFDVVNKY